MEMCEYFVCRYIVDDECPDTTLCKECLYHDCEDCVSESCVLQDGCGCGQTFSP